MSILMNQLYLSKEILDLHQEAYQYVEIELDQIDARFLTYLQEWISLGVSKQDMQLAYLVNVMLLSQQEIPERVFEELIEYGPSHGYYVCEFLRSILSFRSLGVNLINEMPRAIIALHRARSEHAQERHTRAYQACLDLLINDKRASLANLDFKNYESINEIFEENDWHNELMRIEFCLDDDSLEYDDDLVYGHYFQYKREILAMLMSDYDVLKFLDNTNNRIRYDAGFFLITYNVINFVDLIKSKRFDIIEVMLRPYEDSFQRRESADQVAFEFKLIGKQ